MPAAPIVVLLPAHHHADAIAGLIARFPDEVDHHPVTSLVVVDGATDRTAVVARAAGAEVVELAEGAGLGAVVRAGLAASTTSQPAAVALCDPSGEYPPEQLADLVRPVLEGDADYVVGTRFGHGRPTGMPRRRRFGNRLLTAWVRRLTRLPVTDGQSGYRAFSPAAADAAEVIHDFNYAQVLTLDLVSKGFRYGEVPVTTGARTPGTEPMAGRRYLRRVVPAVRRELRSTADLTAFGPPLDLRDPTIDLRADGGTGPTDEGTRPAEPSGDTLDDLDTGDRSGHRG